ncbi:MAG: diphthine--ammonia ligase [Candidatus Bathyarchaeia archaeon]
MRIASLFSGGKDSVYATYLAERDGHDIDCLVTIHPMRSDSYMFHTVNLHVTELQARSWGKRIISGASSGVKESELEDLKRVLSRLDVEGVVSGAIASNYQKNRVERVCEEMDLRAVTPLWGRAPARILDEMLSSGMVIIVTAVAAMGLDEGWLGRKIDGDAYNALLSLNSKYGVDVCGEGGEYETLVLDAPWFDRAIEVIEAEGDWDGVRGTYVVKRAELVLMDT